MERVIRGAVAVCLLIFSGCSLAARAQCRLWQQDGSVQGTIGSCTQCVEQLGPANKDAISGCALGLDAAQLFSNASNLSPAN